MGIHIYLNLTKFHNHPTKMSQNTVIATQKPGEAAAVQAPVPALRDDYILAKVKAVALNPTDWKHVAWLTPEGARIGCDYAGVVEEVGSKVTKPFKKGDRVAGFTHEMRFTRKMEHLAT